MDENTWRFAQLMMWLLGIQTMLILGGLGFIWNNLSKRIDKLETKIEDMDKRLCRIEGSLASQGHCLFNQSHQDRKAE